MTGLDRLLPSSLLQEVSSGWDPQRMLLQQSRLLANLRSGQQPCQDDHVLSPNMEVCGMHWSPQSSDQHLAIELRPISKAPDTLQPRNFKPHDPDKQLLVLNFIKAAHPADALETTDAGSNRDVKARMVAQKPFPGVWLGDALGVVVQDGDPTSPCTRWIAMYQCQSTERLEMMILDPTAPQNSMCVSYLCPAMRGASAPNLEFRLEGVDDNSLALAGFQYTSSVLHDLEPARDVLRACHFAPKGIAMAMVSTLTAFHVTHLHRIDVFSSSAEGRNSLTVKFPPRSVLQEFNAQPRVEWSPSGTHILMREVQDVATGSMGWGLLDIHGHHRDFRCGSVLSLVDWAPGGRYVSAIELFVSDSDALAVTVQGSIWDVASGEKAAQWQCTAHLTRDSVEVRWAPKHAICFVPILKCLIALPDGDVREAAIHLPIDDSCIQTQRLQAASGAISPCGTLLVYVDISNRRSPISHGRINLLAAACVMRQTTAASLRSPRIDKIAWHPSPVGCLYAIPSGDVDVCIMCGLTNRCVMKSVWSHIMLQGFVTKHMSLGRLAWSLDGTKLAGTLSGSDPVVAVLSFSTARVTTSRAWTVLKGKIAGAIGRFTCTS